MRLRRVSSTFFALVIAGLCANALLLWFIHTGYAKVVAAQEQRQSSLEIANQLHQETEQLGQLVRAYTVTGESRYLLYYYDILAVRNGEKPPPRLASTRTYWDDVIAGRLQHSTPTQGPMHPLAQRMKAQGLSNDELQDVQGVLDTTAKMNAIEQIAFAATQGLYKPETQEFVSDGAPRLDFASRLVHGKQYNLLKADLSLAVDRLINKVDQRTTAEVEAARERLRDSIFASALFTLIVAALVGYALLVIRRQVLKPIQDLVGVARVLASGRYSARNGEGAGVEEIRGLGLTLDGMAQAIEDDIRHRAGVQVELEAARKQAELATQTKSMFLANMSHEIRTPMNAMIGMAYLALRTELTPRQRDYVTKVYNAAKSLLGIINDILDFSKVEAGKLELEQVRFRIEDVAGNSLSLLRQRAHEKNIELLLDIAEPSLLGTHSALTGDAMRLGQVITNLLSNAVKFTHDGHVTLSIGMRERHDDIITLDFSVHDTGIGMSPEQVARLFQEFTQADGSTTRKYGGTGLGLTISKRIVELMGGHIHVKSTEGSGTVFSFQIPFQLATPPAPPSSPLPHAAAMRVLVVDDQLDARKSLVDMLLALQVGVADGGCVQSADDGDTALELVERAEHDGRAYDLLLIDWMMPRLDGAGVLRALALREGKRRPLPVIVSAYDSEAMHQSATQLGAYHLLPKPVLPESVRNLFNWLDGHAAPDTGAASDTIDASYLHGMRVLLAEDNQINQQLVVELLEQVDVVIDIASNGFEALEKIEAMPADHYDVVLMDLQMPLLDGYEAARRIRMNPRTFNLPIVAVSAHALLEERERCRILGMNGHVSKPIDPELLYATLAKFQRATRSLAADPSLSATTMPSERPTAVGTRGAAADPQLLSRLRRLLVDGDIEAVDVWRDYAATLRGEISERNAARISAALAEFDFDTAIQLLAATAPSAAQ